jgi:hypothetical protein
VSLVTFIMDSDIFVEDADEPMVNKISRRAKEVSKHKEICF